MANTSFDMSAVGACELIRAEAVDIAKENAPFNLGRATGALDFITNPQNGTIAQNVISDPGEKVHTLRILYDQRTKPCQVSTDPTTNICNDTTITAPRKQAFVNIDKKITSPARYFSNNDLVVNCKPKNEFIRERLMNDLRATRERLDEVLLAELNARQGLIYNWDGGTSSTYKNLQLLYQQNGQDIPQPGNYENILMDYQNMEFSGTPAVIAQGYFDKFIKLQQMSCCNATTPYGDALAGAGVAYYFDQAVNSIVGNNKALVIPYGIMHLLTFNKNNNININTELEAHTVVTDPVNPALKWNLDFKWDCTVEQWKYEYSLHWTVFNVIQSDSFGTDSGTPDCGDELSGVTGVFGYQITRG